MGRDREAEQASLAAIGAVDEFIYAHRAAAIPALIGACVMWAVEHGAIDLVKQSLVNAAALADQIEVARRKSAT